jgi:hypothetical protein
VALFLRKTPKSKSNFMKKAFIYTLVVLVVGASIGSCKLFKGGKDRCPAYQSIKR